jgi:hypothetical protein
VKQGKFPPPKKLAGGERSRNFWDEQTIDRYIASDMSSGATA